MIGFRSSLLKWTDLVRYLGSRRNRVNPDARRYEEREYGTPTLFVAATARPSGNWHAGIHPTDALRARRYEARDTAAKRCRDGTSPFFVAAAARPSASRHTGVHPTDALGARRYEARDTAAKRCRDGTSPFFVAAAARPSASWLASVHPTDALGARRYEAGGGRESFVVAYARPLRSGGHQAVGKLARQRPPDPTRSARAATKNRTRPPSAAVVEGQHSS